MHCSLGSSPQAQFGRWGRRRLLSPGGDVRFDRASQKLALVSGTGLIQASVERSAVRSRMPALARMQRGSDIGLGRFGSLPQLGAAVSAGAEQHPSRVAAFRRVAHPVLAPPMPRTGLAPALPRGLILELRDRSLEW